MSVNRTALRVAATAVASGILAAGALATAAGNTDGFLATPQG